jgi:glycosyltransferase involved in cell wall biosynthesis
VDPESKNSIATGLREALNETVAQRNVRIAEGKRVAARFSWHAAAQSYLDVYERLLRVP